MTFRFAFRSAALAASLLTASALASERRTVQQGFDRSQCSNGMCTVMRVLVELTSDSEEPLVRVSRSDYGSGAVVYSYDTVVQRAGDVCTKDVIVPQDVFSAISAVFRSIAGNGTPPPVLTPAQQTLLLFYTTLMQQTQGFECSPRDLGDVNVPQPAPQPFPVPTAPVYVPPVGPANGSLPPAPIYPVVPGNTGGVIFQ